MQTCKNKPTEQLVASSLVCLSMLLVVCSAARDECRGEDALWCRKIPTCLRLEPLDSRSVALAACVTAHPVQTVYDDVQSDARIGACISVRTLTVALGHLLVATW